MSWEVFDRSEWRKLYVAKWANNSSATIAIYYEMNIPFEIDPETTTDAQLKKFLKIAQKEARGYIQSHYDDYKKHYENLLKGM
jgi:hypothetical protein